MTTLSTRNPAPARGTPLLPAEPQPRLVEFPFPPGRGKPSATEPAQSAYNPQEQSAGISDPRTPPPQQHVCTRTHTPHAHMYSFMPHSAMHTHPTRTRTTCPPMRTDPTRTHSCHTQHPPLRYLGRYFESSAGRSGTRAPVAHPVFVSLLSGMAGDSESLSREENGEIDLSCSCQAVVGGQPGAPAQVATQ